MYVCTYKHINIRLQEPIMDTQSGHEFGITHSHTEQIRIGTHAETPYIRMYIHTYIHANVRAYTYAHMHAYKKNFRLTKCTENYTTHNTAHMQSTVVEIRKISNQIFKVSNYIRFLSNYARHASTQHTLSCRVALSQTQQPARRRHPTREK
jgi:hypothetical protein